jgi:hypothetical protein
MEIATGIPVDTFISSAGTTAVLDREEEPLVPEPVLIDMMSVIRSQLKLDVRSAALYSACQGRAGCEIIHRSTWVFMITQPGARINKQSTLDGDFAKGSENYALLKRYVLSQPFEDFTLKGRRIEGEKREKKKFCFSVFLRWNRTLHIPEFYVRLVTPAATHG